ncbi:solute carrier family 35 member G1-like [Lytechinus variegatus]|uniref:solute carrier family 35 member G1-like n=1 Tax=Lytechinus variegatus TaxID=7654 RepID=UPI001BB0E652|nr:solute carrier family 35 member G1-like [Lytechinus variegatus]
MSRTSLPQDDGMRAKFHVGLDQTQQDSICGTLSAGYPEREPEKRVWERICKLVVQRRGTLWALLSAILLSLIALACKLMSGGVSPNQITLCRSLTLVLFTAPNILRQHNMSRSLPRKAWGFLILRGVSGMSCVLNSYYAFQRLDVSTARYIIEGSSFITCILACICLKENCSIIMTLSCCASMVGVLLVVQPTPIFGGLPENISDQSLLGILAAFFAAIAISLTFLSLRLLAPFKMTAQFITFTYGCISLFGWAMPALGCVLLETALNDWSIPRCGHDRLLLLATCIMSYLQITAITFALQTENAAVVAVITTTGISIAFILDYAFFDVTPNAWKIIGALCVTGGSVGAAMSSYYAAKRKLPESI